MNYKKRNILFSIFLIISIQTLILINNKEKTSLRYFIWNIQDVSIGRLVFFSFLSGLIISSILNATFYYDYKISSLKEEKEKGFSQNDYSINKNYDNESDEIPPERDLRDPQPTISVNYRFINDNNANELKDRNQNSKKTQYQDDWNSNNSEW